MTRFRIIAAAVVLAVIGAFVPIMAMVHMSRSLALTAEQERLAEIAGNVIARANNSFEEAKSTLRSMESSAAEPCSREHIGQMRRIAIDTPSIDEVGYFADGELKCTSWGVVETRVDEVPGDYTTADGIEVTVHMTPLVTRANPVMALKYKRYNVLINPLRFVDVVVDKNIQLAIANDKGALIGVLNAPDPGLLRNIIEQPRSGVNDHELFAVSHGSGWMAVAIEPRAQMVNNLRRQQLLLLPIGVFLAVFIVATVIWFSRKRLSPRGELAIAVHNREFVVHYQPIIELRTGACVGAEALVRWRRPDGTMVRPDLFIPLAEECGLILPITDQVVDMAFAELGDLLAQERSLHLSINLGAADLNTGRVLAVIHKALEDTEIRPCQVWLEATERGFLDIGAARATITRARDLGHMVAIDDFGTGYSSLQYLEGLPVDALKIDKSFIDTIGKNTATSSVTPHIIEMAKTLHLCTVAEGVETAEQVEYLIAHGVTYAQGWFYSKATPVKDFIAFYRRNKEKQASARETPGPLFANPIVAGP